MNIPLSRKKKLVIAPVLLGLVVIAISIIGYNLYSTRPSAAADLANFNPGRIIDDAVFYNSNSMTAAEIQTFLNGKVASCDTQGSQAYSGSTTRAAYSASRGYYPPFTCIKDYSSLTTAKSADAYCSGYSASNQTAAQMIYGIAKSCGINPQVLIVLLQKEQGLINDTWPWSIQYRSATGMGCPDTATCDSQYYGLFNQLYYASRQFKRYQAQPGSYSYVAGRNNSILWSPAGSCGSSTVYIQNQATAGLYNYTPYRPNDAALGAGYGSGDSCSAYGNRNFWLYFTDWFGSTYGTVYNGIDYSAVFDPTYYLNKYPDLKTALNNDPTSALRHFVNYGMSEGRQGIDGFDVTSYKNRYQDLRLTLRNSTKDYYLHYVTAGQREGRLATGDIALTPITSYGGNDYSGVYNFKSYIDKNTDLKAAFENDDVGAIMHFANFGTKEGRIANDTFNVNSYRNMYVDLRSSFGNDLRAYYMHYINYGLKEGRAAIGNDFNGVTKNGSVDYSSVYNFSTYLSTYSDINVAYGATNDNAALSHFVTYGMSEGRQANSNFNVQKYRSNYSDLQAAFGNDLKAYYLHYINIGKKEGRVAI